MHVMYLRSNLYRSESSKFLKKLSSFLSFHRFDIDKNPKIDREEEFKTSKPSDKPSKFPLHHFIHRLEV